MVVRSAFQFNPATMNRSSARKAKAIKRLAFFHGSTAKLADNDGEKRVTELRNWLCNIESEMVLPEEKSVKVPRCSETPGNDFHL